MRGPLCVFGSLFVCRPLPSRLATLQLMSPIHVCVCVRACERVWSLSPPPSLPLAPPLPFSLSTLLQHHHLAYKHMTEEKEQEKSTRAHKSGGKEGGKEEVRNQKKRGKQKEEGGNKKRRGETKARPKRGRSHSWATNPAKTEGAPERTQASYPRTRPSHQRCATRGSWALREPHSPPPRRASQTQGREWP